MTRSTFDLRRALRSGSADQLAELLRRVPALVEALRGQGPLAYVGPYGLAYPPGRGARRPTIERLADLLGSTAGIDLTLAALDRIASQLVTLAVWHDGALTRDVALAEAGVERAGDLDAAAATLAELLLTDPSAGWVVLRPGVAAVAGLPGFRIRDSLRHTPSDSIAAILRNLGLPPP
ncbi:MAG: hypothetical protein M3O86_01325, partial [Actinomycetota bacterium]|nr:hypothetical protein [Actinomycetota bacterium]